VILIGWEFRVINTVNVKMTFVSCWNVSPTLLEYLRYILMWYRLVGLLKFIVLSSIFGMNNHVNQLKTKVNRPQPILVIVFATVMWGGISAGGLFVPEVAPAY